MIRAELFEHADQIRHVCQAEGIEVIGNAPVLALCRKLVAADHDPATPMKVYRGQVLALRVRSIGEGAKLRVTENTGDGRPRFRKLDPNFFMDHNGHGQAES